jgi:hypothetical protein
VALRKEAATMEAAREQGPDRGTEQARRWFGLKLGFVAAWIDDRIRTCSSGVAMGGRRGDERQAR